MSITCPLEGDGKSSGNLQIFVTPLWSHCLADYDSPDHVARAPINVSASSLTIVVNRRDRQSLMRQRKNPDERLRHLDAVSPTRTLEQWWTNTKGKMGLSEAVDGQFVW